MKQRYVRAVLILAIAVLAAPLVVVKTQAQAQPPIKIGILHSLSGTMAIS